MPLAGLSDLLVAGLRAARHEPSAYLPFADLGVPSADDVAHPWHQAMTEACEWFIERAMDRGQVAGCDAQARLVVAAASALNALPVTGAASHADVERAMARVPRLLPDPPDRRDRATGPRRPGNGPGPRTVRGPRKRDPQVRCPWLRSRESPRNPRDASSEPTITTTPRRTGLRWQDDPLSRGGSKIFTGHL
ncbi:hypothetical protein GCM10010297_41470 [Streptomyces malachitofuscus]|nr:hypothetical protein GCM10010297_41470 [Streptomyces malachitofuscus]